MATMEETDAPFARVQRRLLIAAAIAWALALLGILVDPMQFFRSYLFAFLFWLGLALGSLAIAQLHDMTGGQWGTAIRRLLEAGYRTLALMPVLFVPLCFGIRDLYEWASPDAVAHDPVLQHKAAYLNSRAFLLRAMIYFGLWLLIAFVLDAWSRRYEATHDRAVLRRIRTLAGPGVAIYGLTMTFAAIDWAMSLDPHWYSTMYGVLFLVGQPLSTLAFCIYATKWLSRYRPFKDNVSAVQLQDLGNLMMAFVLLWAYVAFSQFLIIWAGNLPEETSWYLRRIDHGWRGVALVLIIFHFALPFALLLSRKTKRRAAALGAIAALLFVARVIDLFWLVGPELHREGTRVSWLDFVCLAAIGAIWLWFFLFQLQRRPLLKAHEVTVPEHHAEPLAST
jgi:hypothetical protein